MRLLQFLLGWLDAFVGVLCWLAVALWLASCSDPREPSGDATKTAAWPMLPTQILVANDLSPCQQAALRAAGMFLEFRANQSLFSWDYVPPEDLAVNGLPPAGVIGVSRAPLSRPDVLDEVTRTTTSSDTRLIYSVDMRLGACSVEAYAHELGHALGLDHATRRGALMREEHEGDAYDLSEVEVRRLVWTHAELPMQ